MKSLYNYGIFLTFTLAVMFEAIFQSTTVQAAALPYAIKNADMPDDMQAAAIEYAQEAFDKYKIEKEIAAFIKKEFDKRYNPTWHCVVGHNFGSYVSYQPKRYIYFSMGQIAVLLFKSV